MDGDLHGCRPNHLLMGRPIPTSTSAGSRRDVGSWLSADDMTSVRPVINRSFLSTTRQFSNLHVRPSSYNILIVMVRMKPGIYLTGINVPSSGDNTLAPAKDECLEALILTGWGEACVRPLVAT
uniref:Far-red impaired response protein-like n=1 Tax=Oryza sativa subsp. japonica TaxID=39947 RepID=Q6K554_ORYSJ|nr:far-red impaired response protein-like [Oryza sativa Japonica Group]